VLSQAALDSRLNLLFSLVLVASLFRVFVPGPARSLGRIPAAEILLDKFTLSIGKTGVSCYLDWFW
jgi:hypothetical protein